MLYLVNPAVMILFSNYKFRDWVFGHLKCLLCYKKKTIHCQEVGYGLLRIFSLSWLFLPFPACVNLTDLWDWSPTLLVPSLIINACEPLTLWTFIELLYMQFSWKWVTVVSSNIIYIFDSFKYFFSFSFQFIFTGEHWDEKFIVCFS